MAVSDLHVNGPAKVQANFGSAWVDLGYTEEGVDVELEEHHEDIHSDEFGPATPVDIAYLGETADLRFSFISWDRTNMDTVESRFRSGKTVGAVDADCTGTLYFAGSKYIGIQYLAAQRCGLVLERYRRFPYAIVSGMISTKVGTRVSRMSVTLHAIPQNEVLYSFV